MKKAVWPDGGGPRLHDLLYCHTVVPCEFGLAEAARDDSVAVNHHTHVPANLGDTGADLFDRLVWAAGGNVGPGGIGDTLRLSGGALQRETSCLPIGDAEYVVIDPGESEGFEPARGSW
ncbi:MAG: hypothetical protein M3N51_02690 [Actinomycetota bacterium]|nr:hypothetical protein [Actinomycetota bacterium]